MAAALEEIWRHLRRDRLTDLLERSVRAYSPSYAEASALRIFGQALEEAHLPVRRQPVPGPDPDPERTNLVTSLGPTPPALLWVGHVDTVPLDSDDHLRCTREGDVLYGLGAADMKSGCAAAIEAVAAVAAAGVELQRGLTLALVVGEEESGDGAEALAAEVSAPLTVIGEPTSLQPCVDHYGYLELRLAAVGQRAHAAVPEAGASAIHAMLMWLNRFIEACSNHPDADGLAVSVRDIRGGSRMFMVADSCEAVLNVHLRPDLAPDAVEELARSCRDETDAGAVALELERLYWAPGYTSDDDDRIELVAEAFGRAGRLWAPIAFRSHSDACVFNEHGAPPIICGPGALELAHNRDEHVDIEEVWQAARLYAAIIHEICIA